MEKIIIKKYTRKRTIDYETYAVAFVNTKLFPLLGYYLIRKLYQDEVNRVMSWLKGDETYEVDTEEYCIERENEICSIWFRYDENENGYCPEDMRYFLTEKNMMHVLQEWKKAMIFQPNYIILQEDDSGWVDLYMKEKLSDEEAKDCEENPLIFTFD